MVGVRCTRAARAMALATLVSLLASAAARPRARIPDDLDNVYDDEEDEESARGAELARARTRASTAIPPTTSPRSRSPASPASSSPSRASSPIPPARAPART